MQLSLIVAMAENHVIGCNNQMPWHLPGDLQYFKKVTMGKPVIMGRKTFESIGRPLPGRSNILITRNTDFQAEGVRIVHDLASACELGEQIAVADGEEEVMVIGGAEIYRQALPQADRLYLTRIHAEIEGDAWFPALAESEWLETARETHLASGSNPFDYSFTVLQRKPL